MKTHCYAFLRKDLNDVDRAIQLAHATQEIGKLMKHDDPVMNLVLLEAADEKDLYEISDWLIYEGITHHMFYEPDFGHGGQHTAICTMPVTAEQRETFRGLDLFRW